VALKRQRQTANSSLGRYGLFGGKGEGFLLEGEGCYNLSRTGYQGKEVRVSYQRGGILVLMEKRGSFLGFDSGRGIVVFKKGKRKNKNRWGRGGERFVSSRRGGKDSKKRGGRRTL